MRLNKTLEAKVNFANFCINYKLDPLKVAEFMATIEKCVNLATKICNVGGAELRKKYEKATEQVEKMGAALGMKSISWPGLYPSILGPDGYAIHFPLD